jgi:hypothetical protein
MPNRAYPLLPSDPRWPRALSIPIYVPRTSWPDFVIYVVPTLSHPPEYYIVPRGMLSKDTALSPSTLGKYRDAWDLLKGMGSPRKLARRFAVLNWQLRDAMEAAKRAGLWSALIRRTRKRWPFFCQTRLIVEGRRCTLHSLSRVSQDATRASHEYVFVRKPSEDDWAEFHLYLLRGIGGSHVFVVPGGAIRASTTLSLKNVNLSACRNNWNLLSQHTERKNAAIDWSEDITPLDRP